MWVCDTNRFNYLPPKDYLLRLLPPACARFDRGPCWTKTSFEHSSLETKNCDTDVEREAFSIPALESALLVRCFIQRAAFNKLF